MIVIFGNKAKAVVLEEGYFFCPACRCRRGASLCRMDDYFHVFFIPLIELGQGEQFYRCNNCRGDFAADAGVAYDWGDETGGRTWECSQCGHTNPNHTYHCERCGEHV